ncbi:unnamed protein product [Sphagnum troendelagicum]|uniref:ATP synthase F0 subunit 8 n=1 Tax=Sphagnum troendelagicum TaxID=128251 RepID=A0ABP0UU40_9BRYO
MLLETMVLLKRSFPWCALWFLCWTKVMKQGTIEGFGVFLLFLLCMLCLHFWVASFCWL